MNYWLSFDDYCDENYRIAKLLTKYNLTGTFFIEIRGKHYTQETTSQIKLLDQFGFEIGCHSLDHPILRDISDIDMDLNILYARDYLQQLIDKKLQWYAPPRGRYNDEVIFKIRTAGFKYIRTVGVLDTLPIQEGLNNTTIHCYPRKEYEGKDWFDLAMKYIDETDKTKCFKMWAHGWELTKLNEWARFEAILERLSHENSHI